jgi:hypothetical protein
MAKALEKLLHALYHLCLTTITCVSQLTRKGGCVQSCMHMQAMHSASTQTSICQHNPSPSTTLPKAAAIPPSVQHSTSVQHCAGQPRPRVTSQVSSPNACGRTTLRSSSQPSTTYIRRFGLPGVNARTASRTMEGHPSTTCRQPVNYPDSTPHNAPCPHAT